MDPCCARFVAPLPVLSPSPPHAHVGICQAARRRRPPSAEVGGVLVWPLFSAGLHCRGIEVRALLSDLERGYWSAVCTGARVVCDLVHFLRPVNYAVVVVFSTLVPGPLQERPSPRSGDISRRSHRLETQRYGIKISPCSPTPARNQNPNLESVYTSRESGCQRQSVCVRRRV